MRHRRMKDIDAGVSQLAGVGFAERIPSALPAIEQRPVERKQPEHVNHIRLGDKISGARWNMGLRKDEWQVFRQTEDTP